MSHQLDNGYRVQRIGSITAVDPAEWNAITGGDITWSYGWLKFVEACALAGPFTEYILLRDPNRLIGAAICQTETGAGDVKDIDAYLLGRLKRHARAVGISFTPILFGGSSRQGSSQVLIAPSVIGDERLTIMRSLIEAIEARAWEQGMSVCFDRVPEQQGLFMQVLEERGYNRTMDLPATVMDIEWNSFEGYVGHLRRARKNTKFVRNEVSRNRQAGVNIRLLDSIGKQEDRLHELLVDNRRKYGGRGLNFRPGFLSRAKTELGKNVVIYVAEKQDQLVGVCLLLIGNGTGYTLNVGVDHDAAGNDFTYFNITYYRPASDAASLGLKRIYFGNSHYDLKVRRGCKIMRTFLYCKSPRWLSNMAAKPFLKMHSAWYRSKLPAIATGR